MKLISIFLVLLFSCTSNDHNVSDDSAIESVLLSLIDDDGALGMDGFGSNGEMDLEHEIGLESESGLGKMLSDTLFNDQGYKIRFGRRLVDKERSVDFEIGIDTAIGSVSYNIIGEFIVRVLDTTSLELVDSLGFSKEFSSNFYRNIRFIKENDLNTPDGYSWKIDAMTPLAGGTGDKVSVSNILLYSLDSLSEINELIYSYDIVESGELFIDRDNLPSYTSFDKILIQVQVVNNGPEFTMDDSALVNGFSRTTEEATWREEEDVWRFRLNLDQASNDNIHSGVFRVHGPGPNQARGIFRTFYETIDLSTLFVSDGGYNVFVWSIPYKVER